MLIRLDAASLAAGEIWLRCRRLHSRRLREAVDRSLNHAAFLGLVNAAPARRRRSPDLQAGPPPRVLDDMPHH